MPELLQEYWILILAALLIGVLVAWWIFHASRRTKVELQERPDDGGAAKRNQALIDAQPAAAAAPSPLTAAANAEPVAAAVHAPETNQKLAEVAPAKPAETETPLPAAKTEMSEAKSADDLRRIKGVGPKLVTLLADLGISSFAQVAAWDDAEIDRIDAQLGRFEGRIRRDDWVAQARLLQADDIAGYEERFGKI